MPQIRDKTTLDTEIAYLRKLSTKIRTTYPDGFASNHFGIYNSKQVPGTTSYYDSTGSCHNGFWRMIEQYRHSPYNIDRIWFSATYPSINGLSKKDMDGIYADANLWFEYLIDERRSPWRDLFEHIDFFPVRAEKGNHIIAIVVLRNDEKPVNDTALFHWFKAFRQFRENRGCHYFVKAVKDGWPEWAQDEAFMISPFFNFNYSSRDGGTFYLGVSHDHVLFKDYLSPHILDKHITCNIADKNRNVWSTSHYYAQDNMTGYTFKKEEKKVTNAEPLDTIEGDNQQVFTKLKKVINDYNNRKKNIDNNGNVDISKIVSPGFLFCRPLDNRYRSTSDSVQLDFNDLRAMHNDLINVIVVRKINPPFFWRDSNLDEKNFSFLSSEPSKTPQKKTLLSRVRIRAA